METRPPDTLQLIQERDSARAERDAALARCDELTGQVARLTAQVTALMGRVSELEALLKQNSGNSGKPPSSDPPYKKPPRSTTPTGKKPGGQDGHEGKTMAPFAAEAVTKTQPLLPSNCKHCGDAFAADAPGVGAPLVFQHVEIPPMPPLVIEYQSHERCCAACGGRTREPFPGDVGPSPYGPRLQALVVTWAIQFHLSRRQIRALLSSLYGLSMSIGTIQEIIERVATACEQPVADLKAAIEKAPFANADETGHMHQGGGAKAKRHWLWVAATVFGAVFAVARERGAGGLAQVLGKDFKGIVGCDRWRPYESRFGERRQLCWAHLRREGQGAIDRGTVLLKSKDEAVRAKGEALVAWGKAFLAEIEAIFRYWHRCKAGEMSRAALRGAMVSRKVFMFKLFQEGALLDDKKVARTCRDLMRPVQWPALWTFVTVEGVEPTNNEAERAIRQPVLLRRKTHGTRSEKGKTTLGTLLSVVETCRRQARSVIAYLEEVIRTHRLGQPPPSLVPA